MEDSQQSEREKLISRIRRLLIARGERRIRHGNKNGISDTLRQKIIRPGWSCDVRVSVDWKTVVEEQEQSPKNIFNIKIDYNFGREVSEEFICDQASN